MRILKFHEFECDNQYAYSTRAITGRVLLQLCHLESVISKLMGIYFCDENNSTQNYSTIHVHKCGHCTRIFSNKPLKCG